MAISPEELGEALETIEKYGNADPASLSPDIQSALVAAMMLVELANRKGIR